MAKQARSSNLIFTIPFDAIVKANTRASKYVQCASNGQVHLSFAELLDEVEICEVFSASSISDR